MSYLIPDRQLNVKIGTEALTIKQKIIPDSARATKDVASYVLKGQPMKPNQTLSTDGKPRGVCIHNTGDIQVNLATTPAEQYTRATWPNQNMRGVVVHYYIWKDDIWQNLREDEQGWHAADGATRRRTHDGSGKIGGNLDCIAIEVIGADPATERSAAMLTAHLLHKYGLSLDDVYTHRDFYPRKACPQYLLPHWDQFLAQIAKYLERQKNPVMESNPITKPKKIIKKNQYIGTVNGKQLFKDIIVEEE